jgi:hypothetical protein
MANVNRPKGFSPIQNSGGASWNSKVGLYSVATDAVNSYAIGDVVMLAAGGDADGIPLVTKWAGAVSVGAQASGVIVGIRVADAGVSLVGAPLSLERTYIPVNSGAHYVYVLEDLSGTEFELQADVTAIAAANMSNNCTVTITANQTTLSSSSPYSSIVATSPAATNTLPIQILGLVQRPDNAYGSYAALRVRFNIYSQNGAVTGRTGV